MADGFRTREYIAASPSAVWAYLTDFDNAQAWMKSVQGMTQVTDGPVDMGTRFQFGARGKERETSVTAFDPGKRIALTSTQGGVTATYEYSVMPAGDGSEVTLRAVCKATGFWKLIHPLIVFAMKKTDGSQLADLKAAIERGA